LKVTADRLFWRMPKSTLRVRAIASGHPAAVWDRSRPWRRTWKEPQSLLCRCTGSVKAAISGSAR